MSLTRLHSRLLVTRHRVSRRSGPCNPRTHRRILPRTPRCNPAVFRPPLPGASRKHAPNLLGARARVPPDASAKSPVHRPSCTPQALSIGPACQNTPIRKAYDRHIPGDVPGRRYVRANRCTRVPARLNKFFQVVSVSSTIGLSIPIARTRRLTLAITSTIVFSSQSAAFFTIHSIQRPPPPPPDSRRDNIVVYA